MSLLPPRLGRSATFIAALETSGRFAWSLLLADFLVCMLVLFGFYAYTQGRTFDPEQAGLIAGGIMLCNLVCLGYNRKAPHVLAAVLFRTLAATGLAVLLLPFAVKLDAGLGPAAIRTATALCTPLIMLLRIVHVRTCAAAPLEALRCSIVAVGGIAVGFPFLTTVTVGTGDAYWYGNMVGDFVQQWRAGIFPVFVGQSDYAFNGAITPLRYAPYLQHMSGILDLLTFRTLSNAGLVNLILVLSLLGAALSSYFCLTVVSTASRWISCLLALIFVSSPAVLALAYTGDLFMSVCALPYLPLIFVGIWRTFRDHDLRSVCLLAIPLAAAWLCHPPIAFWAGVIAALSQIARLAINFRPVALRAAMGGAVLFFALTSMAFTSVLTLDIPALTAEPPLIVEALLGVFPGMFLPVSEGANNLSDYQLGWSLWWTLFIGLTVQIYRPRAFSLVLTMGCLLLLTLLMPIRPVLELFWVKLMPQAVANITFLWPMQRFYVLLAIMSVFLGALACNRIIGTRAWMNIPLVGLLVGGLYWSAIEAVPFLRRGTLITETESRYRIAQLPENRVLTRYAYSPFPVVPPYFSHGYVDPTWAIRLLDIDSFREIDSNYRSVSGPQSVVRLSGEITASADAPGAPSYVLLRDLPLQAGVHYALEFEFNHPGLAGSLLAGGATLARNYLLPNSGVGIATSEEPRSFGSLPHSQKLFPLFISNGQDQQLDVVQFWASATIEQDISRFGRFKLWQYKPSELPVVVENWTPFTASVSTKGPAWLETPRMFINGYRTKVNGSEVPVRRSPAGLVMVPLPAGSSRVVVDYPGPTSLRIAYFFSLAAWLAVLVIGLRALLPKARALFGGGRSIPN